MISKKDSKPFQIKLHIGVEKTNKIDMQYENDWRVCFGTVRDTISDKNKNMYGYDIDFDKIITTNAGSNTRLITENTLVVIDDVATSVYESGNYSVTKVFPEYNGEIVIGLNMKQDVNIPKLYFAYNDKILYYQLNFDEETKKAYVPKKSVLPFKEGDYVWTREPVDSTETSYRLRFNSKTSFGVSKQIKNFYELTFVEA